MAIDINEEKQSLSIGHFLSLTSEGETQYRYQNFYIGETIYLNNNTEWYFFLPFGFSGITVNMDGAGTDASLLLPNNAISRNWADQAVKERWIANVKVLLLNPDSTGTIGADNFGQLAEYYGQIASGAWGDTNLSLNINTILDSVGADFPQRRLTQELVGNLPTSSSVRLQ